MTRPRTRERVRTHEMPIFTSTSTFSPDNPRKEGGNKISPDR